MARIVLRRACWAKAVSLSKVMDLRSAAVFLDQRFTPPAQLIGPGGVKRRVAAAGQLIAGQFAQDGRFWTADRFGDDADRLAKGLRQTNLFSFVIRQMRIASHGNTP